MEETYTFSAISNDNEFYLSNLYPVEFNVTQLGLSYRFDSEDEAKRKIQERFLSLAAQLSTMRNVTGIFILAVKGSNVLRRERYL